MLANLLASEAMTAADLSVVRRWIGDSEAWVRHLLVIAHEHPGIVAVVVMGSAVRPRGHRRSDVDLLVVYDEVKPKLQPPVEVDIRYHSTRNLADLVIKGHEIVCWALKYGVPIYDPNGYWASFRKTWISKVGLPSAEEARARATRSLKAGRDMLEAGDDDAASDLILAALTQLARAELIDASVFPASRPELPMQLREISAGSGLAELLEEAMFSDGSTQELIARLRSLNFAVHDKVQ